MSLPPYSDWILLCNHGCCVSSLHCTCHYKCMVGIFFFQFSKVSWLNTHTCFLSTQCLAGVSLVPSKVCLVTFFFFFTILCAAGDFFCSFHEVFNSQL